MPFHKKLFFLFFFFVISRAFSQNLIPNPGYEDVNKCEAGYKCSPKAWYPVITADLAGLQSSNKRITAHSGKKMVRLLVFDARNKKRTYIQAPLLCPLKKGETYRFEMHVRTEGYAVNSLGAYFSDSKIDTTYPGIGIGSHGVFVQNRLADTTSKVLPYTPQISFTGEEFIYKKNKWLKLEGTYIATGKEQFIIIGNFNSNADTKIKKIKGQPMKSPRVLYYFDDISFTGFNSDSLCDYSDFLARVYRDSLRHPASDFFKKYSRFQTPDTVPLSVDTVIAEILDKDTIGQVISMIYSLDTSSRMIVKRNSIEYEPGKTIIIENLLFKPSSAVIVPGSFMLLDSLSEFLKQNELLDIIITGHTDTTGSPNLNLLLSKNRAKAVSDYLIKSGIPQWRVQFLGIGSKQPIATNITREGRDQNRRVEFMLKKRDTRDTIQKTQQIEYEPGKAITIEHLRFEPNSERLFTHALAGLDTLAGFLRKNPTMIVDIRGYTDKSGNERANLIISQKRAKIVALYLMGRGVAKNRITYKGYGSANPIANNNTTRGRAMNRRVEFYLTKIE